MLDKDRNISTFLSDILHVSLNCGVKQTVKVSAGSDKKQTFKGFFSYSVTLKSTFFSKKKKKKFITIQFMSLVFTFYIDVLCLGYTVRMHIK